MPLLSRLFNFISWRPRFYATHEKLPSLHRIQLLADGLELIELRTKKTLWRLHWRNLKEVIAYKDDLYIYDLICLGFRTVDEFQYRVVGEHDENWNELCDFLQTEFQIDWPRAYTHIVQPPFAPNRTTIWGHPWPPPCPNCNYDLRGSPTICPECGRLVDPPVVLAPPTA